MAPYKWFTASIKAPTKCYRSHCYGIPPKKHKEEKYLEKGIPNSVEWLTVSSVYPSLTRSNKLSAICPDSMTISLSSLEAPKILDSVDRRTRAKLRFPSPDEPLSSESSISKYSTLAKLLCKAKSRTFWLRKQNLNDWYLYYASVIGDLGIPHNEKRVERFWALFRNHGKIVIFILKQRRKIPANCMMMWFEEKYLSN